MSDQPAYTAWQQETTRLMPEILRDACASAVYRLAEEVWRELHELLGAAKQRAEQAEKRAAELEVICAKMRDRVSEAEAALRQAEIEGDWL